MAPNARTIEASEPKVVRQSDPSVTSDPTTTGRASTRRSRLSAANVEPPVEITSSTTATRRPRHRADPRTVEEQALTRSGGDRPHRLADGVGEVDLRRLVQDHVVVEPQGPRHLDCQGDPHRGDGHHDLDLERSQQGGEVGARSLRELHAVVNRDQQGDGEIVGDADERHLHLL